MDVRKAQPPALRNDPAESFRPPLILSEKIQKNNGPTVGRKSQTREVASRCKAELTPVAISVPSKPSKAQRSPSPSVRSPSPSLPKRSQSADRRRPATPTHRISPSASPSSSRSSTTMSSPSSRPSTPVRDVTEDVPFSSRRRGGSRMPDGLWPSMRSLTSSFQSESVSGRPRNSDKLLSNSNHTHLQMLNSSDNLKRERKTTPSKGRNATDQSENLKPAENPHCRVLDQNRWPRSVNSKISSRSMSMSMDLTDRVSRLSSLPVSFRGASPARKAHITDGPRRGPQKNAGEVASQTCSDVNGLVKEFNAATSVPAKHLERDPSVTRPRRTVSLPLPGSPRSSTPCKISSPSAFFRSMATSPSRSRPSTPNNPAGRTGFSSSQSYMVDVRKGKKSANHIEAAHQLRLLYNRNLLWRFVNARAEASTSMQKMTAESILHSVWVSISEMRDSVVTKRISVEQLRQEMKLGLILREQMAYIEDWGLLNREHSSSLLGVTEALKASILRLPVTGGGKADVPALKDAISSAVGVMQAVLYSINHLHSRMVDKFSAVSELAEVAVLERAMLNECRELLSSVAAMQVHESSLRTHLLQLKRDAIRLNPV
ncbi:unnamed protein product [Spirodela intermedia]|uniref:Uncharacterized protein n=1 Tax=Spirodela intermedia TaxID=51605 RepID=A0A7I8IWZ4_SPIIN|nr:unnamed protein product [Spirodela intermedia]CAA6661681.1 unnamed protein product [Spirodela intermedia]